MEKQPKGLLVAGFDSSPVKEDEFNDWYDTEHVPERRAVPGFINCERWVAADNPRISIATYDLETIDVLKSECDAGQVAWRRPVVVEEVSRASDGSFTLGTQSGRMTARALITATGGLSIPKIGATDFAYRLARQFGHKLIDTRPGIPLGCDCFLSAYDYPNATGAKLFAAAIAPHILKLRSPEAR